MRNSERSAGWEARAVVHVNMSSLDLNTNDFLVLLSKFSRDFSSTCITIVFK